MSSEILRTLVEYHVAQSERLWESVMQLTDEQFVADAPYSQGSVRNQIIHLIAVEGRWLRGLRGEPDARAFQPDPQDYPTRAAARDFWRANAPALPAYVASLTDEQSAAKAPGMGEPVWQVLAQVVLHAVDHRALVLRLLDEFGAPTFPQDFIMYLWSRGGAS